MKHSQRIISTILIIITLLAFLPVSTSAANKIETLKYNQWYNLKERKEIYQIKVTTDTIIEASWKNNSEDAYVVIYTDKECEDDSIYWYLSPFDDYPKKSGSQSVVLYKGTYYMRLEDYENKTSVKFTKKPNNINRQNYCISKAINMSKNKKYVFSQTYKENYKRWYKIKLTKSQVISIIGYYGYADFHLYDKNFNVINCNYNEKTQTLKTRGKQAKGIYYIAFYEESMEDVMGNGIYYSICWK